jgi:hypothetical protein
LPLKNSWNPISKISYLNLIPRKIAFLLQFFVWIIFA